MVTLRDLLVPVLADGPALTTGPFHRHEHHLTGYRVRELMTAEPVTARPNVRQLPTGGVAVGLNPGRWTGHWTELERQASTRIV